MMVSLCAKSLQIQVLGWEVYNQILQHAWEDSDALNTTSNILKKSYSLEARNAIRKAWEETKLNVIV